MRPVAFEVDAVVAQSHRAGADHFERHIDGPVEREQMLPLRLQHLAIGAERGEHLDGLRAGDAREHRLDFFEAACGAGL